MSIIVDIFADARTVNIENHHYSHRLYQCRHRRLAKELKILTSTVIFPAKMTAPLDVEVSVRRSNMGRPKVVRTTKVRYFDISQLQE